MSPLSLINLQTFLVTSILAGIVIAMWFQFENAKYLRMLHDLDNNSIKWLIAESSDLRKKLDEKTQYLNDYVKDLNTMATDRARYNSTQFDFLRDEINDIKKHLVNVNDLEYRPHKPEDEQNGDLGQGREV
jgi:predicted nuclease with TOPRIM domain